MNPAIGQSRAQGADERPHVGRAGSSQPCRALLWLLMGAGILLQTAARADAGTPLMWLGTFHLVILNLLIGLLEGTLLAKLFRLPPARAIPALQVANYFSTIAGWPILAAAALPIYHALPMQPPLFRVPLLLIIMAGVSWLLSVLLEWPFCAWALRQTGRRLTSSLRASVIAQTASYAFLIPLYLLVSPTSLLWSADLNRRPAFARPPLATVYYLDSRDGAVWRVRTDGTARQRVLAAAAHDQETRLMAVASRRPGFVQLCRIDQPNGAPAQSTPLPLSAHGGLAATVAQIQVKGTWLDFGRVRSPWPGEAGAWSLWLGFWPAEGVSVFYKDQFRYRLALETPFVSWICRSASLLPSQQAVFQLGRGLDSQIVLLDLPNRKLAVLAMGQGPAVVLDAP